MKARVAVLAVILTFAVTARALRCLGHYSPVATYPPEDIAVRFNDPLVIYCHVEPPHKSSDLKFVKRTKTYKIDLDLYTEKINETSARLFIEKPERQSFDIDCVLQTTSNSCYNRVVVDSSPEDIQNFTCRSYNLQELKCTWITPEHYIFTNYSLVYNVYGNEIACPPFHSGNNYWCTFSNNYRSQEDYFNFSLTSVSRFGRNVQKFYVDHFANLIPGKPMNLRKSNLSAHSINLSWNIPRDVFDFSKGVTTRIRYQIKTVDNQTTWREANVSNVFRVNKTNNYTYLLDNLPYAHWNYDVRIFIKSLLAPNEEEFWSDFLATTFKTKSERPPHPPLTEIGAFTSSRLDKSRDIEVYWQQIDEFYESGENFTYNVEVLDGSKSFTLPSNKSSPVHFSASLQPLNVSIASANAYGESLEKTYIYIPEHSLLSSDLHPPRTFTKTVYGNKTYDLRWQPPINTSFDSYTIFWFSNTDIPFSSGKLHFKTLLPNMTSYTVTVLDDKTYTFAISANRGYLSSGMVKGSCNLPDVQPKNKVADFKRGEVGRRSVELQWDLDCFFSEGTVLGYKLSYCTREDPSNCSSGHKELLEIRNPLTKSVNVTGLMPHTTYSFQVAVIYKDNMGYESKPVDATTLEDKPSEPLNVQIFNITAHSMVVSWDPPELKNGILLEYRVVYYENDNESSARNEKLPVVVGDKSSQLKNKRQQLKLERLQAFTNYTVRVKACTTDCSDGVYAGKVRTAIGAPSRIDELNLNATDLSWQAPNEPGGTLDLYQVEIIDHDNKILRSINSSSLIIHNVPGCKIIDNQDSELYYRVRAVNFDQEKEHGVRALFGNVTILIEKENWPGVSHYGQWSKSVPLMCRTNLPSVMLWILGIVFSALFIVILAFGSKKSWEMWKNWTNIKPIFPPGIMPIEEKKDPLKRNWKPPSENEERSHGGDEALLLPPHRQTQLEAKDMSNSSNTTNSTTLSVRSTEGPPELQTGTPEELSGASSLRDHTASPVTVQMRPVVVNTDVGYQPLPTVLNNANHEYASKDELTSSDSSYDAELPPDYVQKACLPLQTPHHIKASIGYVPHSSSLVSPCLSNTSITFSPPVSSLPKPLVTDNLSMPKSLPMEWKQSPETCNGLDFSKIAISLQPTSKPNSGYVSHTDSVLNKHINNISRGLAGEDPAVSDPDMPAEAYCRYAWNHDPSNLHSIQHDDSPPLPTVD